MSSPASGLNMLRWVVLICVLQLLGGSAIAQSKNEGPMSWKDILNKAGPPVQSPPQKPEYVPEPGDALKYSHRGSIAPLPAAPSPAPSGDAPISPAQKVAASFDCKSPRNSNEKLICQSTELTDLDSKMSTLFNNVLDSLSNTDRQELRTSQREWLKERLDCGDDFICTKSAYAQRIDRLNSVLLRLRQKANAENGSQCSVADPLPPLNVRTTPNGSIVGSLSNNTNEAPPQTDEACG